MSLRLEKLRQERAEAVSAYEALDAETGGNPTDEQQAQLDSLFARAEALDAEIAPLAERKTKLDAGAEVLAKIGAGRPTPIARSASAEKTELPTAAQYLAAFAAAQDGDTEATKFMARAVADQKVADVSGIVPKEIVGNLINLFDASRPVFNSFRSMPMPEKGKTFSRPQVTQHVTVAKNNTEKSESASQKMVIGGTDVTKNVFRGTLDISMESIDWTDPALLQIVLEDFTKVYMKVSETEASTALETAAVTTSPWPSSPTVANVADAVGDAFLAIENAADESPDTLWLASDVAIAMAVLTNSDNTVTAMQLVRQALAAVGVNLNVVRGRKLTAGKVILGNSTLIESYEKQKGLIQAVNVPNFGWDVGYGAYLAFFGVPAAFRSLVAA